MSLHWNSALLQLPDLNFENDEHVRVIGGKQLTSLIFSH